MPAKTWITDEKGNRASIERWGSEDAARAALNTLDGCSGCSDCSDCSDCSRCSDCSGCSGCSDCSGCSELTDAAPVEGGVTRTVPEVPVIEDLHAKIYAAASNPESLNMSTWHTCEKTHCRAGWAVTLAGQAGKDLEHFHDTALAAMLIYDASCPGYKINPARFFDSNEDALEDMRKLAESNGVNVEVK